MSNADEYHVRAAECQRMAEEVRDLDQKSTWLRLAESRLRMIRQRQLTAAEEFEAQERTISTHQDKSAASH